MEGDPDTTVVGVGDYLEKLLTEKYGHKVLHHKGEYDVNDRDHAYSNAAPEVAGVINENPQIQLVIGSSQRWCGRYDKTCNDNKWETDGSDHVF